MQIECRHLNYSYESLSGERHPALRDVSFTLRPGEITVLAGSTGSGKTTLIQHLNGLLTVQSGEIIIDGRPLTDEPAVLREVRQKVGLVFQFPEIQLFEEHVFDDVAFGLKQQGIAPEVIDQKVRAALAGLGLDPDDYGSRHPFDLSGGEKRRVAIAGVASMEPEILVLDEPMVGLDARSAAQVESLLKGYRELGRTVLFISHDMDLTARLADRMIVLKKGEVRFEGATKSFFEDEVLLRETGLRLPRIVEALKALKSSGRIDGVHHYTFEEAKTAIEQYWIQKQRR